ncbi:hypothetical protein UA08_03932 [Talaromyces atroroseus]|uniref:Uncharacterized protein n=1 Tax=Talaromyces atroroseus TaxID=1441469 RepID=A0A225AN19_TALAT|nr:hypothetical protein UA08_03932 [Talaromyces atroroseus]OKL60843.1 hypothetical protein UA08_03932 [Talaromyces atroroseus]
MPLRRTAAGTTPSLKPKTSLSIPLIDSPLPSPVLPSIIPTHGQRRPGSGKRRAFRILSLCAVIFILTRIPLIAVFNAFPLVLGWFVGDQDYQLPPILPDSASPVIMKNEHGRQKWTVHIPADMELPLSLPQMRDLCSNCLQMSQQVSHGKFQSFDYFRPDPNFIDIADRQAKSMLSAENKQDAFCETSLTFVMQSEDAGLGNTLMNLFMSYGLAQKQGRSFFIDDTNWAYGTFSAYFKPLPKPACRPPPLAYRVPCPLQARHLVVSSSNAHLIFGDSFEEYFRSPFVAGETQQKEIFDMAHTGYEALFHIIGDDAVYLQQRILGLNREVRSKGGIAVGVHVRHGDTHPLEAQYSDSYIPLDLYVKKLSTIIRTHLEQADSDSALAQSMISHSKIMLASDDPDVYSSLELGGAERAQNYISLASKSSLDAANDQQELLADENSGWEGGFFQDMFWSLGVAADYSLVGGPLPSNRGPTDSKTLSLGSVAEQHRLQPSKEALSLREWIGRAYLLDLAVLSQSDQVLCGISSASCRLLAVMMGWNKAITRQSWQNIDGNWSWSHSLPR